MIDRLRPILSRLAGREVDRREVMILLGIITLGLALRIAFVLATKGHTLRGDEISYDAEGRLAADGMWFYTDRPFLIVHEGMWKAPGYPAFIGVVYTVLGTSVTRLLLVQTLIGPITMFLTWLLARRLFDRRLALAAVGLAAFYPHMWQWELRMYPEGFALPLALLVMILVLERRPTVRRAAVVGLLMGAGMLVRPTQFFLFALIGVAFWLASGPRRGLALTGLSIAVAALVIAPWTIRNYVVADAFIPISMQDAAAYGTFNDDAKNDPRLPWAWRPRNARDADLLDPSRPLPDGEWRSAIQDRAKDYIKENPASVPQAFFWNGLVRTWDFQRPSNSLLGVDYDGRTYWISAVALGMWWVLLGAALVALWRLRARRSLVLPLLAAAAAASVVFTTVAATRYRLPLEPPVMLLALTVFLPVWDRVRGGPGRPATQA
jgi:4-amino-4-deoxy-L-arabinose transferase-like glycosyltransferase